MEGEFSSRSLVLRLRLAEGSSLRLALLGTKIWGVVVLSEIGRSPYEILSRMSISGGGF